MMKLLTIERLKRLGLDFSEVMYTICFDLADEIEAKGKEAVFSELKCRDEMTKNVEEITSYSYSKMAEFHARILRLALGFETDVDGLLRGNDPEAAISYFRNSSWLVDTAVFRYELMGGAKTWSCRETVQSSEEVAPKEVVAKKIPSSSVLELCEEVRQLMEEVRFYNQRRDQALMALEKLLTEIKTRDTHPEKFIQDLELDLETSPTREINEQSVPQFSWPKRSLEVLHELGIGTIGEAIEYFADFNNFAKAEKITLWEWAVIVAVLKQKKMLTTKGKVQVARNDDFRDMLEKTLGKVAGGVRIVNRLQASDIFTIQDLMSYFAGGASDGWRTLLRIRAFGERSMELLTTLMEKWDFVIPLELCNPTEQSIVEALDFNSDALKVLKTYEIETIGQLVAICEDKNRFSGLRYVDPEFYEIAIERLKAYGFVANI